MKNIEKSILKILSPILKGIERADTLFQSKHIKDKRPLTNYEKCFCGSGNRYQDCHYPEHKKKQKRITRITLIHRESREKIIKYKLKSDDDQVLKRMKPGTINPLNKNRNFTNTDDYDSL